MIVGPAIIDPGREYSVVNTYLALPRLRVPEIVVVRDTGTAFTRHQLTFNSAASIFLNNILSSTDLPFFCIDLLFHEREERLFQDVSPSQRWVSTFSVYRFDRCGQPEPLQDIRPYSLPDRFSVIDINAQKITVCASSGYCSIGKIIYRLVCETYGNSYTSDQIIRTESNELLNKCYEHIYMYIERGRSSFT